MDKHLYNQKQYMAMFLSNNSRHMQIKCNIYEGEFLLGTLIGYCVGGNINISSDSSYRRAGTLDLVLDKDLLPKDGGRIWFNKITKVEVGISYRGELIWYPLGEYVISDVNMSRDKSGGNIQIEILDKMALLDGTLGGESEYKIEIEAKKGMKVNDVIRATVKEIPEVAIERFMIDGIDATIPYDLEFDYGTNVYEILKTVTDLYMHQEFFFDVYGVLRVQEVNKKAMPVIWDFSDPVMNTIISPTNNMSFSNIKNSIRLWGGLDKNTGKHYTWTLTNCGETSDLDSLKDNKIGDLYKYNDKVFYWNGEKWEEANIVIQPKFSTKNIGVRRKVIKDETIMDNKQSEVRAIYEFETYSNFVEEISISTLPIYLLDVNQKIRAIDERVNINGEYLIKTINFGLGLNDNMTINAEKIYY